MSVWLVICRRLQSLQQQQVTHQKSSSEHQLSSRQVGGVSGGGAWPGDRDVSDSDDDDGAEICVVDEDETTTNNDNNDDSGHRGITSPRHHAAVTAYNNAKSAYNQQLSPSRSSADIYASHRSQGLYCYVITVGLIVVVVFVIYHT